MNIAEITKKIGPNQLIESREHLDFIYSFEVFGYRADQAEIFHTLNNYYKNLKYQNEWKEKNQLDLIDFRYQTFSRIESHTLAYHLSMLSTKHDVENLMNECLSLGYSLEMAVTSVGSMREVSLRISYWDRFFYSVEYYVQQMNTHYSFISDTTTHQKQHYFHKMLEFFDLENEVLNTDELVKKVINYYPDKESKILQNIAAKAIKNAIPYSKFYEYAATIRNSLHNNGFSNKTLNNLDIGVVQFKNIKKGEFIECISSFHILMLSLAITEILQIITQKSIDMFPGKILIDPFTTKLRDHLSKF